MYFNDEFSKKFHPYFHCCMATKIPPENQMLRLHDRTTSISLSTAWYKENVVNFLNNTSSYIIYISNYWQEVLAENLNMFCVNLTYLLGSTCLHRQWTQLFWGLSLGWGITDCGWMGHTTAYKIAPSCSHSSS